jgi:hypothetical protein
MERLRVATEIALLLVVFSSIGALLIYAWLSVRFGLGVVFGYGSTYAWVFWVWYAVGGAAALAWLGFGGLACEGVMRPARSSRQPRPVTTGTGVACFRICNVRG